MPISNRTASDLKSFAVETMIAHERAYSQVQKLSAQLAPFTDAEVAAQLGITSTEANTLKSAVSAVTTAMGDYTTTALLLLLGVHPA